METNKITQEIIDLYLADTNEFWSTFHKSLSAPFSFYNNQKNKSMQEWIDTVWASPDLLNHLKVLFNYPVLKGEYFIVYSSGFILTNYRLIINDKSAGNPIIPLNSIVSYNAENDGVIVYEINSNKNKLKYNKFLIESLVTSAKDRLSKIPLNEMQINLLLSTKFELESNNPSLIIPIVKMENKSISENNILINNSQVSPSINKSLSRKDHLKSIGIGFISHIILSIVVWYNNYSEFADGYLSTGGTISDANEAAWNYFNLWDYIFDLKGIGVGTGICYLISIGIIKYSRR